MNKDNIIMNKTIQLTKKSELQRIHFLLDWHYLHKKRSTDKRIN